MKQGRLDSWGIGGPQKKKRQEKDENSRNSPVKDDLLYILFAHGAGANSSHAWMRSWTARLGKIGNVRTFDYDFLVGGRKSRCPKAERSVPCHRRHLLEMWEDMGVGCRSKARILLAGKSYGSRVQMHLVDELRRERHAIYERIVGCLCFGYPLVGATGSWRGDILESMEEPIALYFLYGTRDKMFSRAKFDAVVFKTGAETHVIETGDHSLLATKTHLKRHNLSQDDIDAEVQRRIERWLLGDST